MFRILFSICLLSLAMIAYQLSLMQYLSIMQWHHFAYMLISIALLGFGAAGTIISLFRKTLVRHAEQLLPVLLFISGISMPLVVRISGMSFARFDTYLLFVEQQQLWQLLLNYMLFFIPFFCCALAIGLVFVKYVNCIGKLYFSNLTGSGLGGLAAILLFWTVSPTQIPYITGGLTVISAMLAVPFRSRETGKYRSGTGTMAILFFLSFPLFLAGYLHPPEMVSSQYKSLNRTLLLPGAEIRSERNSPYGWVQHVSSPALRYAPGLSLAYEGEVPVVDAVFNNGDWYGAIFPEDAENRAAILAYTTFAVATTVTSPEKALVLNAGTGIQVPYLSGLGIPVIDAVEPHPVVAALSKHQFLSQNSTVSLQVQDSRSFLQQPGKSYNLICLPSIGAFGGTAGLQAIREEYLLTTDAFSLIYDRLEDNGIVEITTWMDYPYRNPLKIAATIAETLSHKDTGDPLAQTVAVRSWNTITFLIKKGDFSESELQAVRDFCERLYFDPLLLPGITETERINHNDLQDHSLFALTDSLFTGNRERVYIAYDFLIRPATDNRPYFSQFLRWKSFPRLQQLYGQQSASFMELGYLILLVTFVQSVLLSALFIILPLFRLLKKGGGKLWTLLYFSGLGIGYMFVEIVFIQRFALYLGSPVYAITAVIGTMLIFSGAGSYLSSRLYPDRRTLKRTALLIIVILFFYAWSLSWFLQAGMGLAFPLRVVSAIVLIGIPALVMGIPFPLGLQYLSRTNDTNIPWGWGINSCMSVVSATAATIIALETGFNLLMLFAGLAYFITFGSFLVKNS